VRKEGGSSVTLEIGDRAGVMRLGEVLRSAGYDPDRMRPMLRAREDDNIAPQPSDIPVILRLLPNGEPLAGLMKLFLLNIAVSEDEARSALAHRLPGGQLASVAHAAARQVPIGSPHSQFWPGAQSASRRQP